MCTNEVIICIYNDGCARRLTNHMRVHMSQYTFPPFAFPHPQDIRLLLLHRTQLQFYNNRREDKVPRGANKTDEHHKEAKDDKEMV